MYYIYFSFSSVNFCLVFLLGMEFRFAELFANAVGTMVSSVSLFFILVTNCSLGCRKCRVQFEEPVYGLIKDLLKEDQQQYVCD